MVNYIKSFWNTIEVLAILLFVSGMIMGNIDDDAIYAGGRVLFSLSIVLFYFRLLQFFIINETLGLKVFMVYRMVI